MSNLTPIYAHDRKVLNDALAEFRFLLRRDPHAAIPEWLKAHAPLVAEQRALVDKGKLRPCDAPVTLKVVFIGEGGAGQGRLGELLMERIDANATGELYPAVMMAGVRTDAAWRGAMEAAREYAKECSFGIVPGADVRWSVRVLNEGENFDTHTPRPLEAGQKLIGSSAGVAFFLGLFALAQTDQTRALDARKVVEYMIALATFPEAEPRMSNDRLGTLGGTEEKKLRALKSLRVGTQVAVVFPRDYPESILIPHDPLLIDTIADLAAVLRQRSAPPTWPDYLPHSCRASRYIGSEKEVELLRKSFRSSRLHVVSGPGGVGKTARVVEAAEKLWQDGVFPGGRFWVNLCGASETGRTAGKVIATAWKVKPEEKIDDLRTQTSRLLAMDQSIIFLEGAETVPERDIAGLLDWFTGPTTVVWMTRRKTDAGHPRLRGAKHHSVHELSPVDALELLCYAAERKVEKLSEPERADLVKIAKATAYLPLFLGWAGAAMQPDRDTTPAKYLAELKDSLRAIADPDDPDKNAGLFLRLSLDRIVATKEMPDLPALAKRLFAGLAAFHPSYGAPLSWWPLAAGLDASNPDELRRFQAARRVLIGLELVTSLAPLAKAAGSNETLHHVHALADRVASELWRAQSPEQRRAAIDTLGKNLELIVKGVPVATWLVRKAWNATRAALFAHYEHWFEEIKILDPNADPPMLTITTFTLPFGKEVTFLGDPPFPPVSPV